MNGDGYADALIGAYVWSGTPYASLYLSGPTGLSETPAWVKTGYYARTAGDVNGDGYDDVIIATSGQAFVYYGGPTGLSETPAWTRSESSYAVETAGDVNGDGYADVIISTNGPALVYLGGATGLSATPAWASAQYMSSVGTAGDVNGDGYDDVIGGWTSYANGQEDEGAAFVYLGGAGGLSPTPAWIAEGNQEGGAYGISVGTAGDVNGDGYDEVIVGASLYSAGETGEGVACVYYGGAAGPSLTPDWTFQSNQGWANVAGSVGTAGDVNGDGYADVIIGGEFYSYMLEWDGAAFVYLGSATGLGALGVPANADWIMGGGQSESSFGASVGTAGDLNGDGYADVIVGAYACDGVYTDGGAAFVFYGNNGGGRAVLPQQRRADASAPVAQGGQVISPNQARLAALARTPLGRGDVALQWEVKPEGMPFDGSGLGRSGWTDSGTAGASLSALVSGLSNDTRYHWRLPVLGRPHGTANDGAATYYGRWLYGGPFLTALSGNQAIGGTGRTHLLGQAAYVDFTSLGDPAVNGLTVRGYPNTLPPSYASIPGYGAGSQVLPRYFSLEPNEGAAGYALNLCLDYDDAEVVAAGANEAGLQLCRWDGLSWSCYVRSLRSDVGANLVCADDVTVFSDWAIASGQPLAVELGGFTAEAQGEGAHGATVALTWETVSEADSASFNLYRGETEDGNGRVRLANVPAQTPGSSQGASYRYTDAMVTAGRYWYWLEDVSLTGAATLHGPVRVTVDAPTAVAVRAAQATRAPLPETVGLAAGLFIAGGVGLARRRRQSGS